MPFAERHPQSTYLPPRPVGYVPVAGGRGPTSWHCLHCGKRNLSTSKFCGGCAAPSRLPAEFLESLETRNHEAQTPAPTQPPSAHALATAGVPTPAKPVEPAEATVSAVATFTTISVIPQIDPPEPKLIERIDLSVQPQQQIPEQPAPRENPVPPPSPATQPAAVPQESVCREAAHEPATTKAARRRPAPHLRELVGLIAPSVRSIRASIVAAASNAARLIVSHVSARHSLAVGIVSVLVLCALWPMPTLTAAKSMTIPALEGGKPVFWNDMQEYISKKLGLSISDTELLARAAWGDVPSLHLPMTCERALAIESVVNQRGTGSLVVFPNIPFRGPLLDRHLQMTASAPAPFSDVPLDHPVYDAWRALLAMTPPPPVALPSGKACPYEVIRWEEWQPLVAAVWRSCRPGRTPPEDVLAERSGTVTGDDADRSLRALAEGLGVEIGETPFRANPQERPSRMETLAALSRLLTAARKIAEEADGA
ncbi:MAG TPA: hypothetical protein PLU72_10360 [Candidatus Ozemobacteraceae bacterium]|nr:hypothetical protein [Candidatus Ozemobacteraceae bacterium]